MFEMILYPLVFKTAVINLKQIVLPYRVKFHMGHIVNQYKNPADTLEPCFLYQGIKIGPGGNELHFVRNVYGTPLKTGIWYDSTTDIGRILNVHFSPDYWSKSGLPGSPRTFGAHRGWIYKNGTGLHMGRSDWEYGAFVRIDGYRIGMQITKGERGAPNAQFYGFEFRDCAVGVRVADSNAFGLMFTRCTFNAHERAVHLEPSFRSIIMFNTCRLIGKELLSHEGTGAASFQSCTFEDGAMRVNRGSMTMVDCKSSWPVKIECGNQMLAVALVGNKFTKGMKLSGQGAGKVKIDKSTPRFRPLPEYPTVREHRVMPRRSALYVVTDARFGAKSGDNTDDTVAIQKALDAAKGDARGGALSK